MSRSRKNDDDDAAVEPLKVSDFTGLFEALDRYEEEKEGVDELKAAVMDTAKAKRIRKDVLNLVQKLRKLPLGDAQAFKDQFDMAFMAAGLDSQLDLIRDVPPAAPPGGPPEGSRYN